MSGVNELVGAGAMLSMVLMGAAFIVNHGSILSFEAVVVVMMINIGTLISVAGDD